MLRDLALTMAITFALVATRMAAFVFVSPFPGAGVPSTARIGLALMLALAATPMALGGHTPAIGLPLMVAGFGEALAGAAIGFVFKVGMSAADVLGSSLANAMGLTFAASYDPSQSTNSDALTRLVTSAAMVVTFALGAHRIVIGAAIGSFRVVPVGGMLDLSVFTPGILKWVAQSMECGLGLALPAMTVAFIVQIALGLVARAAPALQVFSVGLSVTLGSGLIVILAGAVDDLNGLAAHAMSVGRVLERLLAPGA